MGIDRSMGMKLSVINLSLAVLWGINNPITVLGYQILIHNSYNQMMVVCLIAD